MHNICPGSVHMVRCRRNLIDVSVSTGVVGEDIQQRRYALFRQYFELLSPEKRTSIFRFYKEQYDMFGYEYPTFIDTGGIA